MQYDKLVKKFRRKVLRFKKTANKEFFNRAFRNPDNDVFYMNVENSLDTLVNAIDLGLDAVDYKKENPCI